MTGRRPAPRVRRLRGDQGQVGGIEAIPFGVLVFVLGGLLIANAWAVVDAKLATDAAAREAARTFVEGTSQAESLAEAEAAALASVRDHGRDPARATVTPEGTFSLARCERATFSVSYTVPALSLPLIGGFGGSPFRVRSTHSEVVDPFRDDVPGAAEACT